mmetsp:Transcript_3208/g.6947  ORF Transcript_3208/g.6947 Transcript_3208/m.6947 type:complete len:775 (+) Transcript_3208:503-2827(+)
MTTTVPATNARSSESGNPTDMGWRLPGQHHRSYLLSTDEESGGSDFTLNATVPIGKYYQVSRRAYHQFRDSVVHMNDNNVDEIYLMGNRLIKFLTSVLPQHSQYGSNHEDLVEARDEVKLVLVEAGRMLSEVALYIDRLEFDREQNGHYDGHGSEEEDEDDDDDDEEEHSLEDIIEEEDQDDAPHPPPPPRSSAAWEAVFAPLGASARSRPLPQSPPSSSSEATTTTSNTTTPTRRKKNTMMAAAAAMPLAQTPPPILQSTTTPAGTPRKKNRNDRRVTFSPDVKPGRHEAPSYVDTSSSLSISIDETLDEEHDTFLQLTQMEFGASAAGGGGGSFDDEVDLEDDPDAAAVIISSSDTVRVLDSVERERSPPLPEEGEEEEPGDSSNEFSTLSIDDSAVVAAATDGMGSSMERSADTTGSSVSGSTAATTRQDLINRTDEALTDLTKATQALSVRVRRYETEEVDDVPTDEEHSDVEDGNGDSSGTGNRRGKNVDSDDEFAQAPVNDVSRSAEVDGSDEDESSDPDDARLTFIQRIALENFSSDFDAMHDEDAAVVSSGDRDDDADSDAVDSWAQDGDGDGDDDFDSATTNSETGDRHDFGGDGFLHSELGFDGPLPTFPTDGRDPFLMDKDAPWPDDSEGFDFSAHKFGLDAVPPPPPPPADSSPSSGIIGATKRAPSNDDLQATGSGTDADETAPTLPSSGGSYEFHGEVMSVGSAAAASASARDESMMTDRLDYLESKIQALQHNRSGVKRLEGTGDRSPSPILGVDEMEV